MKMEIRDQREVRWFWADRALIERDGAKLGVYGVAVYCVLARYANHETGTCYPSIGRIAQDLSCSSGSVRKGLTALEELGWIRIERRYDPKTQQHSSNIYYLLSAPEGTTQDEVPHAVNQGTSPDVQEQESTNKNKKESIDAGAKTDSAPQAGKLGAKSPFYKPLWLVFLEVPLKFPYEGKQPPRGLNAQASNLAKAALQHDPIPKIEEIKDFYAWYEKRHPDWEIVTSPDTFDRRFVEYRAEKAEEESRRDSITYAEPKPEPEWTEEQRAKQKEAMVKLKAELQEKRDG